MRRFVFVGLSAVALLLLYYLLLRPFEYEVNFKAKTLPGDLIQTIRIWNRSLKNSKVVEVDSLSQLKQEISWENRSYTFEWNFVVVDSITEVNIKISEPGRSFLNKVLIPFTNQAIERDAERIGNTFYNLLKEHLKITKVKVTGEVELDSAFCVCSSLKTKQIEKANGMMMDYPLLAAFIDKNQLQVDGPPMVRVKQWDHKQGQLIFDFCFSIQYTDHRPTGDSIFFKTFKKEKVLKAEYRGNYITSDRAWYELIHYAKKNGYQTIQTPIEYFHDNPNLGMNEFNWKADVYMPIKNQ